MLQLTHSIWKPLEQNLYCICAMKVKLMKARQEDILVTQQNNTIVTFCLLIQDMKQTISKSPLLIQIWTLLTLIATFKSKQAFNLQLAQINIWTKATILVRLLQQFQMFIQLIQTWLNSKRELVMFLTTL